MKDYRVLFQYFNPDAAGPHFGFTTVHAETPDAAAEQLRTARENDRNFEIVQVIEANDFETGYTYAEIKAQRDYLDVVNENRREGILQIVALASAEERGTLAGEFGTGWKALVDDWLNSSLISLRAAGLLPKEDEQ